MKLHHLALYTQDLEAMKSFFETWFGCSASDRYHNHRTGFSSYFLRFEDGSQLEIMHLAGLQPDAVPTHLGLHHLSISTGSADRVDSMARELSEHGCPILSGPRTTGDGYYEAVIDGPEHLLLELTV